jgi:hypothetical protein
MSEILKCLSVATKIERSARSKVTCTNEMIGILKINSRQDRGIEKYLRSAENMSIKILMRIAYCSNDFEDELFCYFTNSKKYVFNIK